MLDCRVMVTAHGYWPGQCRATVNRYRMGTARIRGSASGYGQSGCNARLSGLRGGRSKGQGGASARAPLHSSPQKKLCFW